MFSGRRDENISNDGRRQRRQSTSGKAQSDQCWPRKAQWRRRLSLMVNVYILKSHSFKNKKKFIILEFKNTYFLLYKRWPSTVDVNALEFFSVDVDGRQSTVDIHHYWCFHHARFLRILTILVTQKISCKRCSQY